MRRTAEAFALLALVAGARAADAPGGVLRFGARVEVRVDAGADTAVVARCLSDALSAVTGVEVTTRQPEWVVAVAASRVAPTSASVTVATTFLRPFAATDLLASFAKPEYAALTRRLVVDLHAVSTTTIDIAPIDRLSTLCTRVAERFDREELGKKRALIDDIRQGLDPD